MIRFRFADQDFFEVDPVRYASALGEVGVAAYREAMAARGWRDMKTTLDLRPVHHRKEDRIRAHVQLCWLALLLIRLARTRPAIPGANVRRELQRLHQGTFRGNAGLVTRPARPPTGQLQILRALGLQAPPTFPALQAAA